MKKPVKALVALLIVVAFCLWAGVAQANGVGIMPGTIKVDKPLYPGGVYKLPSLQVLNTGKEASDYALELARMAKPERLPPPEEYISFSPKSFHLEPGASQVISLNLNLPVKAKPGDYLAFVEAHSVAGGGGGMSIGVAAATKLYFTVRAANIVVGMAYAVLSFVGRTAPYSYIFFGAVVVGVAVYLFRRYVKLEVRMGRK